MNEAERFAFVYKLLADFYAALDDGTSEQVAALFLPDGKWKRLGSVLIGHQEIVADLDKRPSNRESLHTFSNLRVAMGEGQSCKLDFHLCVNAGMRLEDGKMSEEGRVSALMTCSDVATPTPEGWRFVSRESSPRLR